MYFVKKNGRSVKAINSTGGFFSYDEARGALRSYIRAKVRKGKLAKQGFGLWDSISRNPTKLNGFTIVRA